jgi:hypothetical protein
MGVTTTATSFPLSKHTGGGDTALTFSSWGVYLQFTWEVGLPLSPMEFSSHYHFYKVSLDCWVCAAAPAFSRWFVYLRLMWEVGLPHSPVEFSSHCHFYKLSCSWLLGVCHCSCLLQPACEGFPLTPSSALRVPCPLCYVSLLFLLLITQFLFFPRVGLVCPGAMLIWPRVVCGSTVYRLAHLVVHVFPSHLSTVVWWRCRSPPGFFI